MVSTIKSMFNYYLFKFDRFIFKYYFQKIDAAS